ncbi:hypothetical protein DEU56DRAFT_752017 [Suillus clintonianus]|uniref:uncharacterized protein n=1 Tax=Suillus clintonianus TaxID=1904413 RepID=UPI001B866001|nr:uncharacterized protein DEU56DRAFT_752017 [Suillus clintonianus]KAG2152702.1 hypothetical protein DEU56DRAFT_752017 [Suillus clintonianus]
MLFITIPASKKHKSLLEHDSDLDSNSSDEHDTRIEELSEEEEPDSDNDDEDNEPEQSQPTKILTPPPTTSKKRKRGTKLSPSDPDPPAGVKEVTFITSITSAAEMKKPASKRTSRNQTFALNLDEPWDTMKAQVLVKISDALNPGLLRYEDYEVSWFIPRVLPKPGLSLLDEKDFDVLAMIQPINVTIIQKENHELKENEAAIEPTVNEKAKKRKEAAAILPGNQHKITNIQSICEHWICKKSDAACPSTHCYVDSSTDEHLHLNAERFDCWASAMLKDDGTATLEKPPHHKLFDVRKISPVLQRRLDSQNTKVSSPSAPVFNFTIGNEVLDIFRPWLPAAAVAPALSSTSHSSDSACTTLLHPSRAQGRGIPLDEFCTEYDLGNNIHAKFAENAYKEARFLRFVTISELKEMGFQLGEIAALRDAVERWSVPRV